MKPKILVADDEPSVQRMLTRSLGAETYDFLLASNGKDASEMIDAQEPDLVLLDIGMPQKNGWEVLRELRSNSQTSTIPVIMLTGYGSISNKVEGLELGADDYITKPFSPSELLASNWASRRTVFTWRSLILSARFQLPPSTWRALCG